MGFFRRDKEPKLSISYRNSRKVAVVMTPNGPVPLQEVVEPIWVSIAAMAWWGYRHYYRGLVKFDAQTGEMSYVSTEDLVEALRGNPGFWELLDACDDYNVDTQVVLVTRIVFARGFRRNPEDLVATLMMPKGGMPPVAAWAVVERNDELSKEWAAIRAQALGPDA